MSSIAQIASGISTRLPYGQPYNIAKAAGSADALPVQDAVVMITSAGVNAMTLALPKAGVYGQVPSLSSLGEPADDGKRLLVMATTPQLHTITTPTNGINGSKHIATWAAAIGNFIEFIAYNGVWYVTGNIGVTLT
jgi:hypothetical protein